MITNLPQGQMNPELTRMILFNFNRIRRFQQLHFALKREKLQPQPDRERIVQLRNKMMAMYPECFVSPGHAIKHVPARRRRIADLPHCFCTPARAKA